MIFTIDGQRDNFKGETVSSFMPVYVKLPRLSPLGYDQVSSQETTLYHNEENTL